MGLGFWDLDYMLWDVGYVFLHHDLVTWHGMVHETCLTNFAFMSSLKTHVLIWCDS